MIAHSLNNAAGYAAADHLTVGQRCILITAAPLAVLAIMRLYARSSTINTGS
jgi:hypothetical protein